MNDDFTITADLGFLKKELQNYESPVLIYNMDAVREKIAGLKKIGNQFNCRFLYALKAHSDPRVIRFFAKEGIGFDISNEQELNLVRTHARSELDDIFVSLTGLDLNSIQNFEGVNAIFAQSPAQWEWIQQQVDRECLIGLRVSCPPQKSYTPLGKTTRFGIVPEHLSNYSPQALHIHQSGGKTKASYIDFAKYIANCLPLLQEQPKVINLGGSAYYFSIDELAESVADIRQYINMDIPLIFEFGDYWFKDCGYAIGKVIDQSSMDEGGLRVALDLSKECHLRWSYQMPIDALSTNLPNHRQQVSIYGGTCYEGDYMGTFTYPDNIQLATRFSIEQYVIFKMVSIYSASWNISFNGMYPAKVVFHNL